MFKKCLFTKIITLFLVAINLFAVKIGRPQIPMIEKVDMTKFQETPVFADEFNGSSLDKNTWDTFYYNNGLRCGGYWDADMLSVQDGSLHIQTKYMPEGLNGNPAGWYSAQVTTANSYTQKYGYFECRCILPAGTGHWSAFWFMSPDVGNVNGDGMDGTEIDVFESASWHNKKLRNSIQHAIHFDGYGEAHQSTGLGNWKIKGNPYKEFHTYGLEWNEKEYRFYIDGYLTCTSNFGGVSRSPEYLLLSVEVGGNNGVAADSWAGPSIEKNEGGLNFTSDFIVDYVRCYQYK